MSRARYVKGIIQGKDRKASSFLQEITILMFRGQTISSITTEFSVPVPTYFNVLTSLGIRN